MPFKSLLRRHLYRTVVDPTSNQPLQKPDPLKIGALGTVFVFIFVLLIFLFSVLIQSLQKPPAPKIPETDPTSSIELEKKRQREASEAAERAKTPQAQLTKAYNDIVGSPDFLKGITFEKGQGTIRYVINSKDNNTILTTGYQNFADFADRSFNIKELNKLSLIIYATGIVDSQGQTTTPAMTLEISRAKSEQVNWQINKFRYPTYPENLEVNKIHPSLQREYETLVKKNN